MGFRDEPLTAKQYEVLRWIGDGCPSGVFDDYSHRISARALSNRGLVAITGHGKRWSASLTSEGSHYLKYGRYPVPDAAVKSAAHGLPTVAITESTPPEIQKTDQLPGVSGKQRKRSSPSVTAQQPIVPTEAYRPVGDSRNSIRGAIAASRHDTRQISKTDRFISDLIQAGSTGIAFSSSDDHHYRQLTGTAKRCKKIPHGMRIVLVHKLSAQGQDRCIALIPQDKDESITLNPVPVPQRLRRQNIVVRSLTDSKTFQVTGESRYRALLCLNGIVAAAEDDNMAVEAAINVCINEQQRYQHDAARHDEIRIAIEEDVFRVWIEQPMVRQRHEPTRREIALVGKGILFPDYDELPGTHLVLHLVGEGNRHWGDHWSDTDTHLIEDDLPKVLEEIRLRHNDLVLRRQVEAERAQQEQEKRERHERALANARETALEQYRYRQTTDLMIRQAEDWRNSNLLTEYAIALEQAAETYRDQRAEIMRWASEIKERAIAINPIPDGIVPELPEPTAHDLQPLVDAIMGRR